MPAKTAKAAGTDATGRLHLITGSDTGAIRQHARELVARLCGGDPAQDPCVETIGGDRDGVRPVTILAEVLEALSAPPFFGPHKTVWLKNFDFAVLKKDKRGSELLELLNDRLAEDLPTDLTLVIDGPGLDGRSRFIKTCKKLGAVSVLAQPDPNDRRGFADQVRNLVQDHCQAQGIHLAPDAYRFLTETVGYAPGRLRSELDKLFAYVHPAQAVTLADCRAVCSRTPEVAAWAFTNALGQRNLADAFAALDLLRESRAEPIAVLAGVVSFFQLMLQVRMAAPALKLARGCSKERFMAAVASPPPQVKAELGETFLLTANPYRAWNVFNETNNYSDDELRQAFASLVETSRQLVSGAMNPPLAMERLAVNLCRRTS